jgi:hypothetical protein
MDHTTLDVLARQLGATLSRRAGLGLVLGAALAGLGLMDERVAEGKRKRRKKRKKKRARRACPESAIDCGRGVCVKDGECCPGEKVCGGGCIRNDQCCPHTERQCPGGSCVRKDACCPVVEERCGAECCKPGEECCNGTCVFADGSVCTADGWCSLITGFACCAGSISDCTDSPCCDIGAGETCCVTQLEPFIETTCCAGGGDQCAPGGCCPVGTRWKGDCEACCTNGVTGCQSCQPAVGGRG